MQALLFSSLLFSSLLFSSLLFYSACAQVAAADLHLWEAERNVDEDEEEDGNHYYQKYRCRLESLDEFVGSGDQVASLLSLLGRETTKETKRKPNGETKGRAEEAGKGEGGNKNVLVT